MERGAHHTYPVIYDWLLTCSREQALQDVAYRKLTQPVSREERLASHKGGEGNGSICGRVAGSKSPSMSLWNKAIDVAKQAQHDDPDTNSSGEEGAVNGEEKRRKRKMRMKKSKAMEIQYVLLR
jgi:hypothetical protein